MARKWSSSIPRQWGVVEYATPEVTSARDLVAHEKAGEQIVQDIADRMRGEPNPVYKRSGYDDVSINEVSSIERTTAGHHENYSTPMRSHVAQGFETYSDQSLQSYLSTRAVWAGAGIVGNNGFKLSQKLGAIRFDIHSKRSGPGPKASYILNNGKLLNRLEIRLGDGNMSEWAIQQKFAFTSLVLRLIEHGCFPRSVYLSSTEATQAFHSTLNNLPIKMSHGHMPPATHQRLIAEAALEFAGDKEDIPSEEISAAQEIVAVCRIIESLGSNLEGASQLSDRVDWAAKLTYLRAAGIEHSSTKNLRAVMIDLKWEDIAKSGIARIWYKNTAHKIAPNQIEIARVTPPTTRALARVSRLASLVGDPESITWDRIEQSGRIYRFDNPHAYAPI